MPGFLDRPPRPQEDEQAGGELLPEARECLKVIAGENLCVSSGHLSADEAVTLFREVRAMGVTKMVATHGMADPGRYTVEQMQQIIAVGGVIEHVFLATLPIGGPNAIPMATYAEAIRAVGAQNSLLSTDLGQAENAIHPMGFKVFIMELMKAGVTKEEIDWLTRINPARVLDVA